jgi:hypothetical protein
MSSTQHSWYRETIPDSGTPQIRRADSAHPLFPRSDHASVIAPTKSRVRQVFWSSDARNIQARCGPFLLLTSSGQ